MDTKKNKANQPTPKDLIDSMLNVLCPENHNEPISPIEYIQQNETVEVTGNGITVNVTVPIDLLLGKEVDFGNGAIILPENKKEEIDYVGFVQANKVPIAEFNIEGVEYRRVNAPKGLSEEMFNIVGLPNCKVTLFEKQNTEFGAGIIKSLTQIK